MFTSSDVSVIIPSYNSRKTIGACLDSILSQEEAPREVIVVDSSADGAGDFVARCYPGVRVHRLNQRTFPGPARNYGASIAGGSIVAFIDADCIAAYDWVRRVARRHSEGHQVVGGAIEVGNPGNLVAWAGHLGEFREFLPVGEGRSMLHVPTCNLSYRRPLFSKYGGFPNAYYPQEDLLFNYMLNRRGLSVWFDPEMRVRHFCREDLRGFLSHQHRIGRVTRCTLRRLHRQGEAMPGSGIARRGWLAWLLSPALGALKFLRTARVLSAYPYAQPPSRPGLFFLLLLGSIWWARGFASGARTGLSGVRGWNDPDEPIFARMIPVGDKDKVASLSEKAGR